MGWPLRYGSKDDTPENGDFEPVFQQNIPRPNPLQSKFLYLIELESRIQQSVKKEKKKICRDGKGL